MKTTDEVELRKYCPCVHCGVHTRSQLITHKSFQASQHLEELNASEDSVRCSSKKGDIHKILKWSSSHPQQLAITSAFLATCHLQNLYS